MESTQRPDVIDEFDDYDEDDGPGPWPFIAVLAGFKVVTLIIIMIYLFSWGSFWFILESHVLWELLIIVAVLPTAAFWFRMLRVRAKRKTLQRQEWEVSDTPATRP
ncbi:MAG TPA: hypothetical protein VKU87_12115 [Thermomicrobiaceae bacterium]|nr:hypothetical protein [Thermomicrobiaceae bacterium]